VGDTSDDVDVKPAGKASEGLERGQFVDTRVDDEARSKPLGMVEESDEKVKRIIEIVETDARPLCFRFLGDGVLFGCTIFLPRFLFREKRFVDDNNDVLVSEVSMGGDVLNVIAIELRFFKLNGFCSFRFAWQRP